MDLDKMSVAVLKEISEPAYASIRLFQVLAPRAAEFNSWNPITVASVMATASPEASRRPFGRTISALRRNRNTDAHNSNTANFGRTKSQSVFAITLGMAYARSRKLPARMTRIQGFVLPALPTSSGHLIFSLEVVPTKPTTRAKPTAQATASAAIPVNESVGNAILSTAKAQSTHAKIRVSTEETKSERRNHAEHFPARRKQPPIITKMAIWAPKLANIPNNRAWWDRGCPEPSMFRIIEVAANPEATVIAENARLARSGLSRTANVNRRSAAEIPADATSIAPSQTTGKR